MSWKDIAETIGKAAPLIGSALGGPAGAGVGALVATALGVDNTPESVAAAMGHSDAAAKLQQIQATHREALERLHLERVQLDYAERADQRRRDNELTKAELADTQNARDNHKLSLMPAIICSALTVISSSACAALFFVPVPQDNKDILVYMVGQVVTLWASSVAYWVGTTRSSQEKTRLNNAANKNL